MNKQCETKLSDRRAHVAILLALANGHIVCAKQLSAANASLFQREIAMSSLAAISALSSAQLELLKDPVRVRPTITSDCYLIAVARTEKTVSIVSVNNTKRSDMVFCVGKDTVIAVVEMSKQQCQLFETRVRERMERMSERAEHAVNMLIDSFPSSSVIVVNRDPVQQTVSATHVRGEKTVFVKDMFIVCPDRELFEDVRALLIALGNSSCDRDEKWSKKVMESCAERALNWFVPETCFRAVHMLSV